LERLPFVQKVEEFPLNRWLVTTPTGADQRPELARFLAGQGVLVVGMRTLERSLEDAFVTITDAAVRAWAEK
jgi:phosphopantothenate synthetase